MSLRISFAICLNAAASFIFVDGMILILKETGNEMIRHDDGGYKLHDETSRSHTTAATMRMQPRIIHNRSMKACFQQKYKSIAG